MSWSKQVIQRWFSVPIRAVFLVSFVSGLPLLLLGSTLQAWYTVSGASLVTIGALTWVGQAYLYKFLWSPLLDRYQIWPGLGRRKSWMVVMQLGLALGFLYFSYLTPATQPLQVALVATTLAVLSATQDMAIDAYRREILQTAERAWGSGVTNIAYRIGMLLGGAIALLVAAHWGWSLMYIMVAVGFVVLALVTCRLPRIQVVTVPVAMKQAAWGAIKAFWQRHGVKRAWAWLLLVASYKFAESLSLSLNTPFLLRAMGFSLVTVASVAKLVGTSATLIGGLLAGLWLPRLGLYRALVWFGWGQAFSILGFAYLAWVGPQVSVMVVVTFVEYFFAGMAGVAVVVLLMGLCDSRHTAVQFAALTAVSAIARVVLGPLAAWLVAWLGWAGFYVLAFMLALPSLLLLWQLRVAIQLRLVD